MIITAAVATIINFSIKATHTSILSIRVKSGIVIRVLDILPFSDSSIDSNLAAATKPDLLVLTIRPSASLLISSIGAPRITSLIILTIAIQLYLVDSPDETIALYASLMACFVSSEYVSILSKRTSVVPTDIVMPLIMYDLES